MFTTNVIIKSLTALLLVLPVGGYALGSLAASSADDDVPRQTIQLEQAAPSSAAPADRGHRRHPVHQRSATGSTDGAAESTGSTEPASTAAEGDEGEATAEAGDDSRDETRSGHVETIVPRYHESGESQGPEPDDDATTAATTDDGGGDGDQGDDAQHGDDDGNDDHGGDRQGEHHGADRDGGGR